MPSRIKHHPIRDKYLYINNKEYTGLDIISVKVGLEEGATKEVYKSVNGNLSPNEQDPEYHQPRLKEASPWFILALETGKRGWFPGCIICGNVENIALKAAPDETSEVLYNFTTRTVIEVLDLINKTDDPIHENWHHVKYNNIIGYVRSAAVQNIRYGKSSDLSE